MMRLTGVLLALLVAGCTATGSAPEPAGSRAGDPLAGAGKADGDYCDLQRASIQAQLHTIELDINVCHARGVSTRLEIGEEATGRVGHEPLGGDPLTVGCTVVHGEVDVTYGLQAEGHVYIVPVTPGQRVYARLDDSSRAALDILERVYWSESVSELGFSEAGRSVDVTDDGRDALVHEKDGERFVVLRVRPAELCPGAEGVDYELAVRDAPSDP